MGKLTLTKLSDTIKSARKAQKLTQLELSEKTGINRSILSKFENSEQMPSIERSCVRYGQTHQANPPVHVQV